MHFIRKIALFCKHLFLIVTAISLFIIIQNANASPAQGALTPSTKGTASATANVIAEDASALFFNPATLTQLDRSQFTFSMAVLDIQLPFTNRGTTVPGGAFASGDAGESQPLFFLPNMYLFWNYSPRVKFAVGLTIPHGGIGIEHGKSWFGRYFLIDGKLAVANLEPSIAIKLNHIVSFGAGIDIQYAYFKRQQAIFFGGPPFFAPDGQLKFKGDNVAVGYNFGFTFTLPTHTIVGLSYTAPITQRISGNVYFNDIPGGLGPLFTNTTGTVTFYLPPMVDLGIWQQFTSTWGIAVDATWMGWSRQKNLIVTFTNPAQPTIVLPQNWGDIIRLSIGTKWNVSRVLVLRGGFAYDPTPVSPGLREVSFPEIDKIILALGFGLQLSDDFRFDFAYQHRFGVKTEMITDASTPIAGVFRGTVRNFANAFIFSGTWNL